MKKSLHIFLNTLPILVMIGLIPLIGNDFVLAGVYIAIIITAFAVQRERNDGIIFLFGLFAMTTSEYLFISTGVETFQRNSLFGLMPLWLPLLWGYGFVAIKRAVMILGTEK